jgi:S-formylglutathione hydrolase FrmB
LEPWAHRFRGRVEEHWFESRALRGNPLGDPHVRPLWVSVPAGYDEGGGRYPSVYVLQSLTGQLDMWRNRRPFSRTFLEAADDLFATGQAPPCLVVWVDAWTSIGGSQFLDSPATGPYHTYLCEEVVPWVDRHYRTLPHPAHRGIMGHSSGGYGAMVTCMLRPDLFGGFASHAGDCLFEACYLPDFPKAARALREEYGGSYERFWEDFRSRPAFSKETDAVLLNVYCMAACYSADPDGTVRLPFDPATGALDLDVWGRWLAHDPVRMVPRHADALRSLRAVYLDAGRRDEYFLDLGAEALRRALAEAGITDVRFELFEGRHGGIDHRYPLGLRYLAERLAPDT